MSSERSAACVIVSGEFALIAPALAVTVVVPMAFPIASPELLMFTSPAGDDVHNTLLVMSCELPSLKIPTAENWADVSNGTEERSLLSSIVTSGAAVTCRVVVAPSPSVVAAMTVLPICFGSATPFELTVATSGFELVHVTPLDTALDVLSVKLPTAVSWVVSPRLTYDGEGASAIDTKAALPTVMLAVVVV